MSMVCEKNFGFLYLTLVHWENNQGKSFINNLEGTKNSDISVTEWKYINFKLIADRYG